MQRTEIEADRKAFLLTVPVTCRQITGHAFAGDLSPRQAIKAKCLDCSHYDRAEIADCQVFLCPLHAFRPFQKNARKQATDARASEQNEETAEAGI